MALAVGDLIRLPVIPGDPANAVELARAGVSRPAFYPVRPDGHIGLCGVRVDVGAITRYITGRLHLGK